MTQDLMVITGATGHIGHLIAEKLLAQNKKVRVIGRDANKLKPFGDKGAEVFVGNVENTDEMCRALQGAKAVFLMIPPDYKSDNYRQYQNRVSESFEKALRTTGVRYVVNLSSLDAHRPDKLGPING